LVEGGELAETSVPAAVSLPSRSKMISRLPKGRARPAITRRVLPFWHSNGVISPLTASSTICSLIEQVLRSV
jgi:hypothetical protein